MKIIAKIYNDYTDKFGIPRQSGIADEIVSKIIFEKEFNTPAAIKGIDEFSHLWLIWNFSENERENWSPTVRPPRLGGNKRVGVFATRSPFRPNPIGLSCVKLLKTEITKTNGVVLYVSGADIMNGTPIYDIKPYIPYSDCIADACGSFAEENKDYSLKVEIKDDLLSIIPQDKQSTVLKILSNDPRPSYHNNSERVYGMSFGGLNIKFTVSENLLQVTEITKETH